MNQGEEKVAASFRDPSGYVFNLKGKFYRFVSNSYTKEYDQFIQSGLYKTLVDKNLIISHKEIKSLTGYESAYKILLPEQINYISYPYEWSFSQLKDAALATLEIQEIALKHGMILKDATAYNFQFIGGKPLLIDTLSFEIYEEGEPWVAYRQFCQHFLAPLALMSYNDLRLGLLSKQFLDGVPLDLASRLLPAKTKFSLGLATHLHLHAKSQKAHSNDNKTSLQREYKVTKLQLTGIIQNLKATIKGLKFPKQTTEWGTYYDNTNYSQKAFKAKQNIISKWVEKIAPKMVWDAGANDGSFSRLTSKKKIFTVASDIDPVAIENAYLYTKKNNDNFLAPLIIDLTNPSPAIGWDNQERLSFLERSHFDVAFCLAFIHHLAIANNLPFLYIAELFSSHAKNLIIEFVPKTDSNAKRLLVCREDIFPDYDQAHFEKDFAQFFIIKEQSPIPGSSRVLYWMVKKNK